MSKPKIICIGNFGWDDISIGKNKKKVLGGSAWRFAQIAALFKIPALVVSGIDNNKKWQQACELLQKNAVLTDLIKIDKIPVFKSEYSKNLDIKKFTATDAKLLEKALLKKIDKIDFKSFEHIHICPLSLKIVKKILAQPRNKKAKISLQLHFSLFLSDSIKDWMQVFTEVDYLFASFKDLTDVISSFSLKRASQIAEKTKKTMFLTHGHKGAYIFKKGKMAGNLKAIPMLSVKEPTGAGDAFAAGTIVGLLSFKNTTAASRLGMVLTFLNLADWGSDASSLLLKDKI
ncbi:carbohydrate kinase family protein [Patescibacteria group bacterium]